MVFEKICAIYGDACHTIRSKFKTVTLNFLFITLFITAFQSVFGPENSIVGIILIIIMTSAMMRDLTSTPVKQFFIHLFILESMTICAFLVTHLPAPGAAAINFVILLVLLYAFTFEYATHLYMPYILSYLFLLFISPVTSEQLPRRFFGMLAGAVCIIAYQLIMGRSRIKDIPRQALSALVEEAQDCVCCMRLGHGRPDNPNMVHDNVCRLSRLIFERRKRTLCISDASFAMLECGRALERLILLLYNMEGPVTPAREALLRQTGTLLDAYHGFLAGSTSTGGPANPEDFSWEGDEAAEELCRCLADVRHRLLRMTDPGRRTAYRKTPLSFWIRLKAALNLSSVRLTYAVRVALLLTVATLFVQHWQLPHGKWLLFTLASVSLPHADDVPAKAGKRLFATLLGGGAFVVAFTLFSGSAGRTVFMMLAGYLTSYFSDYKFTFSCSSVGALGGAAMAGAFGLWDVGGVFLIRLFYICVGIVLAYLVNCVLFPFRRRRATQALWDKHISTVEALGEASRSQAPDLQLYFSLLIQAYLQDEKLRETIDFEKEREGAEIFRHCQEKIRALGRQPTQVLAAHLGQ